MRRLATAAAAFSAAVFAANYLLSAGWLPVLGAAFAVSALTLTVFFRGRHTRRAIIAMFAFAAGFGVFMLHSARTTVPARQLDGETVEMTAVLLDYPDIYDDYCRAEIRLGGALPHLRAILYDNDRALTAARPGQTIRLTAKLRAADTRWGKDYDYYNARGIYLTASAKSDIVIEPEARCSAALPAAARRAAAGRIMRIFPADTAHFMRSVMLGDKDGLYDDLPLYTALSRAGFMHVAAVSGMHVSFLVGLLRVLLGKSRRSSFICIAAVWVFAAVTGASASAVRAAFMQSLLLFAPVVRRENDPVTSLSTVLALVLLQNPHAAASISLQLSFGAMVGIFGFYEGINSALLGCVRSYNVRRVLEKPIGIVSCSLAVMVVTVPITAVHFGSVSVLSPVMNVAALWAVSLCFCGGYAACALSLLSVKLGTAAGWLVSWAARYIFAAAKLVSGVPFAVLYLDNVPAVCWLVLVYVLFIAAAFLRVSPTRRFVYPLAASAVTLALLFAFLRFDSSRGHGTAAVLDVGQGQSIAVLSGDAAVVVDCGGGGKTQRAGEIAGAYLLNRGHKRLDALVLTHLHSDHANGVRQLMELVDVGELILPAEPNDDDGLLAPILESAAAHGTPVVYVDRDMRLEAGGIKAELYAPAEAGDANERCVMCLLSLGSFDMLVTGDAPIAAECELIDKHDIRGVEVYVAGHHGSKYSSGDALLSSIGADTAVISVGYNNYGHPTPQALERLAANGYTVYRTDENGRIEVHVK